MPRATTQRKRKGSVKRRTKPYKPIVVCEETWLLLQDAADLMDEVHRLFIKAAEYDEDFQKSRSYKAMLKRIGSKG